MQPPKARIEAEEIIEHANHSCLRSIYLGHACGTVKAVIPARFMVSNSFPPLPSDTGHLSCCQGMGMSNPAVRPSDFSCPLLNE